MSGWWRLHWVRQQKQQRTQRDAVSATSRIGDRQREQDQHADPIVSSHRRKIVDEEMGGEDEPNQGSRKGERHTISHAAAAATASARKARTSGRPAIAWTARRRRYQSAGCPSPAIPGAWRSNLRLGLRSTTPALRLATRHGARRARSRRSATARRAGTGSDRSIRLLSRPSDPTLRRCDPLSPWTTHSRRSRSYVRNPALSTDCISTNGFDVESFVIVKGMLG